MLAIKKKVTNPYKDNTFIRSNKIPQNSAHTSFKFPNPFHEVICAFTHPGRPGCHLKPAEHLKGPLLQHSVLRFLGDAGTDVSNNLFSSAPAPCSSLPRAEKAASAKEKVEDRNANAGMQQVASAVDTWDSKEPLIMERIFLILHSLS